MLNSSSRTIQNRRRPTADRGDPDRFEITAELVPAWNDASLIPDTADSNANLFFTDADLQSITAPDSKPYYRLYHVRGADFLRNVARQWSLNETGRYSPSPLSRGKPFDFSTVIPAEYITGHDGKRSFARFARQFLPCLSQDPDSLNSVGILVEFSLNYGSTWQILPSSIRSLPDECGIYIAEPNLAEMVDANESVFSGGPLDGVQINYYTSLAEDVLLGRSFAAGQWRTRVRVTASVQTDRRIARYSPAASQYSSPFHHRRVYDFPDRYGLSQRTSSSVFAASLPADESDSSAQLSDHLDAIRDASQNASLSGLFVLDRLWLGDHGVRPDFLIGDGIEAITGRDFSLSGTVAGKKIYPEIVRIVYQPPDQRMQLITRDLRFEEVTV